jgi:glycerophosphoryl diester phosphodiesterase
MPKKEILVVGHRGAAGLEPENTLGSFQKAVELGVDAVECDLHLSADGELIVIHDDRVDRTTNGKGKVAKMTLSQLRQLDAGKGGIPNAIRRVGNPQRIPTFQELLDLIKGKVQLFCELKAEGTAGPAAAAAIDRGMADDILFISFKQQLLRQVKQARRSLRIGALFAVVRAALFDQALALGIEQVGVQHKQISLGLVERVNKAGIALGAWTPNTPDEFRAMLALGVQQLTTDRPDLLLRHLRR